MKIATLIARLLLGLIFFVFGLNGFLHFIPMGPMPTGLAGQFISVFTQSHLDLLVAACEVLSGLLLLTNQFVPLGLTILGPLLVNILFFHLAMEPRELPLAIVVTLLWGILMWRHRQSFAGLFVQHAA